MAVMRRTLLGLGCLGLLFVAWLFSSFDFRISQRNTEPSTFTLPQTYVEPSDSTKRFYTALQQRMSQPFDGYTSHSKSGRQERNAYAVIYIDDDRGHLCGARALIGSIRASGSTKDVLALIPATTQQETRAYLTALGYLLREVPLIRPNVMRDGYYASMFTSINLWAIEDYDRVVKLDTDMILLDNIDELFSYNVFAATLDWPAGRPVDTEDCKETELCQQTSHDWRVLHLNGAMYVVKPNKAIYNDMLRILDQHTEQLIGGPSEQGFLNWYFRNKWFPLPPYYNVRFTAIAYFPQLFMLSAPKTLHYIGAHKPWKQPWSCDQGCRNNPLAEFNNGEWYRYFHYLPMNQSTTPPVHCITQLPYT